MKGRAIGVLDIQSPQLDYFTRDQQNILTLLASRLAIAIENARLFLHARRQAETLLVLNEVARETSSILELEKLLTRAAELIKRLIDYQILSIMLYDERTHTFRHRIDVKYGQTMQGKLRVAATEGIVGAAAASRQPVRVPDTTADPRYLMVNPETRSELAIPLMHKNRVIGRARSGKPGAELFQRRARAGALDSRVEPRRFHRERGALRTGGARRIAHGARTAGRAAYAGRAASAGSDG